MVLSTCMHDSIRILYYHDLLPNLKDPLTDWEYHISHDCVYCMHTSFLVNTVKYDTGRVQVGFLKCIVEINFVECAFVLNISDCPRKTFRGT